MSDEIKDYITEDVNYKNQISVLDKYEINEQLLEADMCHLYKTEIAYPEGYWDSMFFNLWIFNSKTMEKRLIENRDGLHFSGNVNVIMIRIFIDGSTFVRFNKVESIDIFQCVEIGL